MLFKNNTNAKLFIHAFILQRTAGYKLYADFKA